MTETRTVHDPFLAKDVDISNKLTDRLRGRYAVGPIMPNGEPEFGWQEFPAPPIQHEAAASLEAKDAEIARLRHECGVSMAEIAIGRQRAENVEAVLAEVEMWIDRVTDGEHGVDYLNGDSNKYPGDGWDDLDALKVVVNVARAFHQKHSKDG